MLLKKDVEGKEEIVRAGELMAAVSVSGSAGLGASKCRVLPLLSVTDTVSVKAGSKYKTGYGVGRTVHKDMRHD